MAARLSVNEMLLVEASRGTLLCAVTFSIANVDEETNSQLQLPKNTELKS